MNWVVVGGKPAKHIVARFPWQVAFEHKTSIEILGKLVLVAICEDIIRSFDITRPLLHKLAV